MQPSKAAAFRDQGFVVFEPVAEVLAWVQAARPIAERVTADPDLRATWLRHEATWFVGVDALPNQPDGAIGSVLLTGPWEDHVAPPDAWHPAQISVVYPGYPGRDPEESEANHQFRIRRAAAHVDGLLPEGPARRRFLREPHAFVLGLPLDHATAAPLVVWPGSHRTIGQALTRAIGGSAPMDVDLTDAYRDARRHVFSMGEPVAVEAAPGQAILLHRHLLHGVAPWDASSQDTKRMVAYFRPQFSNVHDWLSD